jgi:hypothetical protein
MGRDLVLVTKLQLRDRGDEAPASRAQNQTLWCFGLRDTEKPTVTLGQELD